MRSLLLVSCVLVLSDGSTLRQLGSFHVRNPAFTTLYKEPGTGSDRYNLLVSTFAALSLFGGTDNVEIVRNIGQQLSNVGAIHPQVVTSHVKWPNEVTHVPDGVFSNKEVLAIPDGFLVPLKTEGSVKLLDITHGQTHGPYTITGRDGSWFYHRVQWHDMDGDGDQDIVSCRAREPVIGSTKDEELVWLENPAGNYQTHWTTHVLAHGPGSFFRFVQLTTPDGPQNVVITAQFFRKSLTVYWTTQTKGLFSDASTISTRVIDNTIGAVFDVELVDLNNDGRKDLLVTTNGANGTLLAYEVPDDFRTGTFKKHTLAVGFVPRQHGIGKGAPGSAFTVHPATKSTSEKPSILLSGDDDGRAYLLVPHSQDHADWTYTKTAFCDVGTSTVGQLSVADVTGDGYADVFVPAYNKNLVYVYTFAPDGAPIVG